MAKRSTRFGILIGQHGFEYPLLKQWAQRTEELGYESFWVWDHFFGKLGSKAPDTKPFMEGWSVLAALSEATTSLRLGTLVTAVSYRYPSLLAKIVATVDHISGGRVELGLGAGWYEYEYDAYGIPFPKARFRIEQLAEALQICKLMFTRKAPSFKGKYFNIHHALNNPKPVQKPHPPIWVGGWGEKYLLRVVAKYADGFNTGWLSPKEYKHKLEVLQQHCSVVNRDVDDIGLSYIGNFDPKAKGCVQKVRSYVNLGAELIILEIGTQNLKDIEVFAEKTMPRFT